MKIPKAFVLLIITTLINGHLKSKQRKHNFKRWNTIGNEKLKPTILFDVKSTFLHQLNTKKSTTTNNASIDVQISNEQVDHANTNQQPQGSSTNKLLNDVVDNYSEKLVGPLNEMERKKIILNKGKRNIETIVKQSLNTLKNSVSKIMPTNVSQASNIAGTLGGFLAGTSTLVNGINNRNWVEITTGAFGIISGVAPFFGPYGPLVGAFFSFLSGFFSFFVGFVSPSQPPKETQEEMIHRVVLAAIKEQHIEQLKREITGVQHHYRSLASSVSSIRSRLPKETANMNEIKNNTAQQNRRSETKTQYSLSTEQGMELYSRAFSDITKLGVLQDLINEYCEVGEYSTLVYASAADFNKLLVSCNNLIRMYCSLSLQRQMTIVDLAVLLSEGNEVLKNTALIFMDVIKDERIEDRTFLRFLYEPLSFLNRRFAVSYIFDRPEENHEVITYLKLLDRDSSVQSPVVGCKDVDLQGICAAIENGVFYDSSYESVFVPSGTAIRSIEYRGIETELSNLNEGSIIKKDNVVVVLPHLKKEYSISVDVYLKKKDGVLVSGSVLSFHGTTGLSSDFFISPKIDVINSKFQFVIFSRFDYSIIYDNYLPLSENKWYRVTMKQKKADNGRDNYKNSYTISSLNKNNIQGELLFSITNPLDSDDKRYIYEYQDVSVFVGDNNPTNGLVKNLILSGEGYFVLPLETVITGPKFEIIGENKIENLWTLKFSMKIFELISSNQFNLSFECSGNENKNTQTTQLSLNFDVSNDGIKVSKNEKSVRFYPYDWISFKLQRLQTSTNLYKLNLEIEDQLFFTDTSMEALQCFSKMAVILETTLNTTTDRNVGIIKHFYYTSAKYGIPTNGNLYSDSEYNGPSTINKIININYINKNLMHFFNQDIVKYKVITKNSAEDNLMLNYVRFCDTKVENKINCRWYKETTKIVEAKKHIYEPLEIASILIPVNKAVKLYKLDKNQLTLGKEYYGPDFIDCIPQTYTHFEIKNHNKTIKVVKICAKTKCESLHLPDENTTLFNKLADSNTECKVAYNSIISFKIPDGVAITFYKEKNDTNVMGPFTGPTMVSDKYKSFGKTIHLFRYIKTERTDTKTLQLCEGKDFTQECVYFYVNNENRILSQIFQKVLSMKIPKGTYIIVTKNNSSKRKFNEGNFNVPEDWCEFEEIQLFNTF